MPYVDRYYKNQYEEEIWKLKAQLALYESDDAIAAIKKRCDLRIQAVLEREKRAHDSWMKALAANKELKQKNTQLRNERDQFKYDARSALGVNKSLEKRLACAERRADALEDQLEELKKQAEEKDSKIKALEEALCKEKAKEDHDGTTSGIPTSRTPEDKKKVIPNTREKSGKKRGGQSGHEKHSLQKFDDDEITEEVDHTLDHCPECGGDLEELPESIDKDEGDWEVRLIRRRHHFKTYRCKKCGRIVHSKIPLRLKEANQYGPNGEAMLLALLDLGFVSTGRARELMEGFLTDGTVPSLGFIGKVQKKAARMLKGFEEEVRKYILKQRVLYWDDTVIYIDTARGCFRFYGNERAALYKAHQTKGAVGLKEDGILENLSDETYLMHDHVSINYRKEYLFKNLECDQHLDRDLQKNFQDTGHSWSKELKELIAGMIRKKHEKEEEGLTSFTDEEANEFENKVMELLTRGGKECAKDQSRYFHNDEQRVLRRIRDYYNNYFMWIGDFSLPTTNNLSERSLRMTKTKLKVAGQFWKVETAREFALVRTYTETCRRNGINEHQALRRLMEGNPYTLEEVMRKPA